MCTDYRIIITYKEVDTAINSEHDEYKQKEERLHSK